jgi:hypothetical protein
MPDDIRNPEFEAEIKKKKIRQEYLKAGTETAEEFINAFTLNWTYRNDFAKIVITLSSGILALLVALSSSSFFKNVPAELILANMILLLVTIALNLASLWTIIKVTLVRQYFMELEPTFGERFEEMIKKYGRFEPDHINDLFLIPFAKTWKSHNQAYSLLNFGKIFFICSLLALVLIGVIAMPSFNPDNSINRSSVNSAQSLGSNSNCKGLNNR